MVKLMEFFLEQNENFFQLCFNKNSKNHGSVAKILLEQNWNNFLNILFSFTYINASVKSQVNRNVSIGAK